MNDSQILKPVDQVWRHHCAAIEEALDETIRALQNLLRLNDYHRHGHEESHLRDTLGPFANANLNLSSLSEVLSKAGATRNMPEERLERINQLLEYLSEIKESCVKIPDELPIMDIGDDEKTIHVEAEAHLNRIANIFSHLRKAQMEIRSKYDPSVHDAVFENFSWRLLNPAELSVCPPFVIFAPLGSDSGDTLRKIMSLLESRKPFKIVALRSSLRKIYSPTADPSVPATLTVETIPLAMRGVCFLQSCTADPFFDKRLFQALVSPRPTLISLLAKKDNEDAAQLEQRASRAIQSRAFPIISYDPDRAKGFVACFDLTGNPKSDDAYTFADYAFADPDHADDFSDPPENFSASNLVPVADYLELVRHQRVGKLPCVYAPDDADKARPKVVSQPVVTQTSDQLHLWKTLQELAGEDNPFVKTTAATLQAEHGAQQKALLENLQKDMEETQVHREQVAVASAVQRLVSQLTGVDSTEIDLQNLVAMGEAARHEDR